MKRISAALLIFSLCVLSHATPLQAEGCPDPNLVAQDIRRCVVEVDVDGLMKHFNETACHIDNCMKKERIERLLRQKNNYFYDRFFGEKKSMRAYFLGVKNFDMIFHMKKNSCDIVYSPADKEALVLPTDIYVRCVKGRWLICGIDDFGEILDESLRPLLRVKPIQ